MQTRNVYYSQQPDRVIVNTRGSKAIVEIPVNVTEVETEDGKWWLAEVVYFFKTMNTPNLKERIENAYDTWLDLAKKPSPQTTELTDVVEALNALTEIVLGGEL